MDYYEHILGDPIDDLPSKVMYSASAQDYTKYATALGCPDNVMNHTPENYIQIVSPPNGDPYIVQPKGEAVS